VSAQLNLLAIPRRFTLPMREIWEFQLRLPRRSGRRAEALLGHKRFRAAYDFLLLRELSGENLEGLGDWWTAFQEAGQAEREHMQDALSGRTAGTKARRRRSKSRRKRNAQDH